MSDLQISDFVAISSAVIAGISLIFSIKSANASIRSAKSAEASAKSADEATILQAQQITIEELDNIRIKMVQILSAIEYYEEHGDPNAMEDGQSWIYELAILRDSLKNNVLCHHYLTDTQKTMVEEVSEVIDDFFRATDTQKAIQMYRVKEIIGKLVESVKK